MISENFIISGYLYLKISQFPTIPRNYFKQKNYFREYSSAKLPNWTISGIVTWWFLNFRVTIPWSWKFPAIVTQIFYNF